MIEKTAAVSSRRFVTLDQDGTADGWLHVVVEASTGIVYQQQYGGHMCRQGRTEGFLVPVFGPDALDALRQLFEEDFAGAGTWNYSWPDGKRARLRGIIEGIPYWASDGHTEDLHTLRLDESRIRDADEAWVPVITPDGPGVLLWANSD
ncbi:DUF6210 family protein [Streptomyces sp. NPDC057557]|uniref:DUF6210 family protein n=1 Tax=Streptomyces sp. NPDC057557 TaxID=3346167 RepID=UPI003699EF7A